jgi:hypothetical protein
MLASNGVPSEKVTPSGNVIVHVLKSALGSIDLARYGTALPFSSNVIRESITAEATVLPAAENA